MARSRHAALLLFVAAAGVTLAGGCPDKKSEVKDQKGYDHKAGDGHDHKEGDGRDHKEGDGHDHKEGDGHDHGRNGPKR